MAPALFWLIALAGLVALRWPAGTPGGRMALRCRAIVRIRVTETVWTLGYLAVVLLARWDFALLGSPSATWAGVLLAALGSVLVAWAKIHLRGNFSVTLGVREGHQLIATGPYAWIRHPIYTGFLLLFAGGALVHDSGATLVFLFLPFCVLFYWQSWEEEKLLEERFGDEYRRYRAATGRLLPWRASHG